MTSPSTPVTTMQADAVAAMIVCAVDEPAALPRALGWALRVWGGGLDDAPLAAIHDLGFVLLRGRAARLCSGRERVALSAFDDDTRAVIRRERLTWEERVVTSALRDPALQQAAIVIAGAPEALADDLIVHALLLLLPRLMSALPPADAAALPRHAAGTVRPLLEALRLAPPGEDVVANALETAPLAGAVVVAAVDAALDLGELARARAADPPPLLLKDELWELARLDLIPSEAMRLALRTVHRVMDDIGPVHPSVVARLRDRRQDVPVDELVADTFPAGGFDAMSTRGVLENLVRSEVGYVGVGADDVDGRGPDLFDVRFVEGELLYYTRDESPLLERRRQLIVLIDEVERQRHKLRELPSQTIVLVEAVVLQAFADLQLACGAAVSGLSLAVAGADADAVAEERGLLQTSLHAELAHRRATLVDVDLLPTPGRITFSPRPPPTVRPGLRQRGLWVRVGAPLWELYTATGVEQLDPTTGLRALADRLLTLA